MNLEEKSGIPIRKLSFIIYFANAIFLKVATLVIRHWLPETGLTEFLKV